MYADVTLRKLATPADYEVFRGLLMEYAASDLDDPKNSTIWRDLQQLPGRYAGPQGAVLVANVGDELAGCGALVAAVPPGLAEIKRVYVRAGFRRRGLARTLTLALIDEARACGYRAAAICTWPHNTQAIALYLALGFVPIPSFREPSKDHLAFLGLQLGSDRPTAPPPLP